VECSSPFLGGGGVKCSSSEDPVADRLGGGDSKLRKSKQKGESRKFLPTASVAFGKKNGAERDVDSGFKTALWNGMGKKMRPNP